MEYNLISVFSSCVFSHFILFFFFSSFCNYGLLDLSPIPNSDLEPISPILLPLPHRIDQTQPSWDLNWDRDVTKLAMS